MNFFRNNLDKASSPYLLQHANNPVYWQMWTPEVLYEARRQNKLILLSIGYATCHWCHVMEKESFSDPLVAEIMNSHYICIKVDREELPEVDAYYMEAVQLMGVPGGWPLNCVLLPDGKPVFGTTYLPRERWLRILSELAQLWAEDRPQFEEYAKEITSRIESVNNPKSGQAWDAALFFQNLSRWQTSFDEVYGGFKRAPKFPLPIAWQFWLQYALLNEDHKTADHVHRTLSRMVLSGIYDQVEGGFFRYSTDIAWHIPHFEKMLYDNAQLLGLYATAHRHRAEPLYRQVVKQTLEWLDQNLRLANGLYASGLDADSEGEEGRYYVFTAEELKAAWGKDYCEAAKILGAREELQWEGHFHLFFSDLDNSEEWPALREKCDAWLKALKPFRKRKAKPALDNKALMGWNALLIKGLAEAALAFPNEDFMPRALNLASVFWNHFRLGDGRWCRARYEGHTPLLARADDLAFATEALTYLAAVSGCDSLWGQAKELAETAIEQFYDPHKGLFHMQSRSDTLLIPSHMYEVQDSVTPSANSVMAFNLYVLGNFWGKSEWIALASRMMETMASEVAHYPSAHALWAMLRLYLPEGPVLAVALGEEAEQRKEVAEHLVAGVLPVFGALNSKLEFFSTQGKRNSSSGSLGWRACHLSACLPPEPSFSRVRLKSSG
ncbi:MAG: thioredoxin domain-containing protein [Flavobacteriales bacterium]|nr:thioredoxin domain-containing protein [Flavobacteriales bacterium]MCX7767743.1 thioredoxin domain-containing protein [Flavobacteriales bacterium]MDW8409362.1 thioredoxin domain-containing protein [Flavobacteriales bacterium]